MMQDLETQRFAPSTAGCKQPIEVRTYDLDTSTRIKCSMREELKWSILHFSYSGKMQWQIWQMWICSVSSTCISVHYEAVHRSYSSQRAENGYSENLEFAATLRLLYCKFTLKFHPSLSGCSTRLLKKLRSACSILGRKFWDDNRILFQPNGVPLGARRWLILCTA